MRDQFLEPMLASLVEQPPDGEEWIHGIKHDGYRTLLSWKNGKHAFMRRDRRLWRFVRLPMCMLGTFVFMDREPARTRASVGPSACEQIVA